MRDLEIKITSKQSELYDAFIDPLILEILFWWWARSGKTWGICTIILQTMIQFPWIKWLIWRNEWDDLVKTTIVTMVKVLNFYEFRDQKHYTLSLHKKTLDLYNGSWCIFVALKRMPSDPEYNWLGWYEVTHGFIEEAQEVPRKPIDIMSSRLTEKIVEYGLVGKIVMSCNPMRWHLYSDFIHWAIQPFRKFIPALYTDNPYIDHAKYRDSLMKADKITRERLLHGNWEYDENPYKLYEYAHILSLFSNFGSEWYSFITCDVARHWNDKTVIMIWKWMRALRVYYESYTDLDNLYWTIVEFRKVYNVPLHNIIVDEDGVWWWLVDRLKCVWFINNSRPLPESWTIPNYANLKTQCYFKLIEYISSWQMGIHVEDEDIKQYIIEELDVICRIKVDSDKKIEIIKKEDIVEKIWRSPDFSDTIMMRMYFELKKPGSLKSLQDINSLMINNQKTTKF